MEKVIHDPNRSDRRGYLFVGLFVCGLAAILFITDPENLAVAMLSVFAGLLMISIGFLCRPYVVLASNGITRSLFLRKRFYRWDELEQVGIRNTKATRVPVEYLFPIVFFIPAKTKNPLMRDLFYSVSVPNRKEIREFVIACYGAFDFNDIDKLNDWERRYYQFD